MLTQLVDLPGQVGPLPLGLGTSLALSLEFLLHVLDAALDLLDSLLGLGNQVLLVVKLGSKLGVVLLLVADGDLNVPLAALKLNNAILGHLEVALELPLLLLHSGAGLLLFVQAALKLTQGGFKLGLDCSQVVNLLADGDHVVVGLGLRLGNVLLLLVQLVDNLILLGNLVLEHLDGVVAVALLQLNLGNSQLNVLDFLLDNADTAGVGLHLSGRLDLGRSCLGLPVGVDGNVALLLSQLLAHGFDLGLQAVHAALEVGGDVKGLLVLAPSLVGLLLQEPQL